MKFQYLVLVLVFAASKIYAQNSTLNFSLISAIKYAHRNNYNAIKTEKEIEKTEHKIWEIIASGLPQINGKIQYKNFILQAGSLVPAVAFDPTQRIIQVNKEYFNQKPLKTYEASTEFIEMRFGQPQSIDFGVTLTQNIFDGNYIVSLQSLETYRNIANLAHKKTKIQITEAVTNSYASVLIAQENLKIFEKNKKTLAQNLNHTQQLFKNGLTKEESVQQLQLSINTINNQIQKAKQQIQISLNLFKYTLGIDLKTKNKIQLDNTIEHFTKSVDLKILSNDTLNYSKLIDYNIQQKKVKSNELILKAKQYEYLPSISAFISYNRIANNNNLNFFKENQLWQNNALLGVTMNIPIFSSFGRNAKIQQSKVDLENAKTNLNETKNKIKLDFDNAKTNYLFSVNQFKNAKKNVKLSQQILDKTYKKFKLGTASSFDLSNAYNQLFRTQQQYLQSFLTLIRSKTSLYKILNI